MQSVPGFARGGLFALMALAIFLTPAGGQARKTSTQPAVDMVIEKRGTIRIELLSGKAPKTAAHFLDLTDRRFYDGTLFHRLEAKFVAQGGDPESRKIDGAKIAGLPPVEVTQRFRLGMGGSGKTVPLEASMPCMRGTVGLGHGLTADSGDSQFFFNLSDNHRLDNQYAVFGRVVHGLDVMDSIRQGDRIKSVRRVSAARNKRR